MRTTKKTKPRYLVLKTLEYSQKEAVASSTMTAACDNFLNAFAIHLNATNVQMGWLTAFPQFIGASMQLVSIWIGGYLSRRLLITVSAIVQAGIMVLMAALAAMHVDSPIAVLIALAIGYHAALNLIQPQWRAWMGSMVPVKKRGVFFAARTRLTMATSLVIFIGGGLFLTLSENFNLAWLGFTLLFSVAASGRFVSSYYLWKMHDPDPHPTIAEPNYFFSTIRQVIHSLHDKTFRHYSFFVAGMQGMVAISAPFFAVYMLEELHFTYFQFSLNAVASIATQFVTLRFWGKISDQYGNRRVMLICSAIIPTLPALWLVSPNFFYLLAVQALSGFSWSGFTLSTANYLYDIRPHRTNFATYAAVQSSISAVLVFTGALAGGYLASYAPDIAAALPFTLGSSLFVVFIASSLLRSMVFLWFVPSAVEPHLRTRPHLLQIVFRIARFNAISGVVLDWLTVTERKPPEDNPKNNGNP